MVLLLLSACINTPTDTIRGTTMGTTYGIQQIDGKPLSRQQIEDRLGRISAIFSTWDPNSELSLLNQKPINQWLVVSDELFFLLSKSQAIYQQTHGYFDPGIGRLLDIWGFGVAVVQQKPSLAQISEALKNSSIKYLELKNGRVKKTKDIHIDLSAIAKGYGLDEIAKLLMSNNSQHFLVEIGGEVATRGKNANRDWTLGIEHPHKAEPIVIKLNNQAIATSGGYRNYFIWQTKRYMHILNPSTGLPVNTDLASVSVLHPQTMMADAYATAMMAMGSKKAIALARQLNLSAVLIFGQQHDFKVVKINL